MRLNFSLFSLAGTPFLAEVPTDQQPKRVLFRTQLEWDALSYYGTDCPPPTPPPLTKEEEKDLFIRYRKRKTMAVRERLVRQYLCWSFEMAAKFKGPRLCFDDAISAANHGLMEALDSYKPEKKFRFTTYAWWVVRRHLVEAMVSTYPVYVSDHLRKKWRLQESDEKNAEAMAEDGEPRTLKEFFQRLGESVDVDLTLLHERPEDAPFVPSEAETPAETLERTTLPADVWRYVRHLTKLEQAAIRARYRGESPESYEATGRRLKVSKNRVREAHDSAIVKLRRYFST